jgi:glycosyltransferase involved in cell wall biosynthesis
MPSASPKVSVIIPSYNCERYIAQTIDSVLNQTFKDFELIVVDDGSADRTRDIVASYGPAVQLIAQQNTRVCAARNRGISEARGQYVCLMDHDDYWFPHKIEQQVSLLEDNPEAGVVYSAFILWHADASGEYPDPSSFDATAYPEDIDQEFSGWIYHQFLLDCWMLTSTAMFRREVFERCGDFDVSLPYSEDWDLWLRISREYPFIKQSRPTTLYRQHPGQGNRALRPVDYRTELLERAVAKWGMCSPDGRCMDRQRYARQLALYHTEFALSHAVEGNLAVARRSLLKAWRAFPRSPKPFMYLVALTLGWHPNW